MNSFRAFVEKSLVGGESSSVPQLEGGGIVDDMASKFNQYADKTRSFVKNTVSDTKEIISDPDYWKWILASIVIPSSLFIILSPGLLLNLPRNSETDCDSLVPKPDTSTGKCVDGSYVRGTADPEDFTAASLKSHCEAQHKCRKYTMSGYTSTGSIILHSFVFVVLSFVVMRLVMNSGLA
jgi:hypothetical protein